ncbi:hypothetical protein HDU83_008387, partial [Entophlyctis luteolus]
MSKAARLLLARASNTTLSSPTATPTIQRASKLPGVDAAFKSPSSSAHSSISTIHSHTASTPTLRKSTTPTHPARGARPPIDSARTFGAPAPVQVVCHAASFAVPKHSRPLSRSVQRFLVNAAVAESVHPQLGGAIARAADPPPRAAQRPGQLVVKDGATTEIDSCLKYHLHPPELPSVGLALEPYDFRAMNPPTKLFKLHVPVQLNLSLKDPRNLVGLEGAKLGGRILMRKIAHLYEVPKCPKVRGRITPVGSYNKLSENLNNEEGDFNDFSDSASTVAERQPSALKPRPQSAAHAVLSILAQNTDICRQGGGFNRRHRNSPEEVAESFSDNVGSIFPLDYFMDNEEHDSLVQRVFQGQNGNDSALISERIVRCRGLINTSSGGPSGGDHVWHAGALTAYNKTLRQFRIEWDAPYPPRRCASHLHAPDPSRSSRWLSRSEILLDGETTHAHLLRLEAANSLRCEYESRLTLQQICGMIAPALVPSFPDFPKKVVELMYWQVKIVQDLEFKRFLRNSLQENADAIPHFPAPFIASLLNEIRENYFASQVEASVAHNPRFKSLFSPKRLKKIIPQMQEARYPVVNSCRKEFKKNLLRMRECGFLTSNNTVREALQFIKNSMNMENSIIDEVLEFPKQSVAISDYEPHTVRSNSHVHLVPRKNNKRLTVVPLDIFDTVIRKLLKTFKDGTTDGLQSAIASIRKKVNGNLDLYGTTLNQISVVVDSNLQVLLKNRFLDIFDSLSNEKISIK